MLHVENVNRFVTRTTSNLNVISLCSASGSYVIYSVTQRSSFKHHVYISQLKCQRDIAFLSKCTLLYFFLCISICVSCIYLFSLQTVCNDPCLMCRNSFSLTDTPSPIYLNHSIQLWFHLLNRSTSLFNSSLQL